MKTRHLGLFAALALAAGLTGTSAYSRTYAGVTCNAPPRINCPEANCLTTLSGADGNAPARVTLLTMQLCASKSCGVFGVPWALR